MIIRQPLEQFTVSVVWGSPYMILTNVTAYLIILLISFITLCYFMKKIYILNPRMNIVMLYFYKLILNLFKQQINNYTILQYFPIFFIIFYFVGGSNLLGLMPFAYTLTSQLFITSFLAFSIFWGITTIGIMINKKYIKYIIIPQNIRNMLLLHFLISIECISYIIRPLSLSIRLFANMLAGHTLLFIPSSFIIKIANEEGTIIFDFVLLSAVFVIFILEIAIASIQTYVFGISSIIYLDNVYLMGK